MNDKSMDDFFNEEERRKAIQFQIELNNEKIAARTFRELMIRLLAPANKAK